MTRIISAFILGVFAGGLFLAWADNARPWPPLVVYACAAMDLEGGVNMDGQLVCFEPGSTVLEEDILDEVLARLQAGLDWAGGGDD